MLTLKCITAAILLLILAQDLKSRAVTWPLFPLLAVCGFAMQWLLAYPIGEILTFSLINILFLGIQFLLIALYFRLTRGSGNHLLQMIGWGDLLFLIAAAFFLPVITFLIFYVTSLMLVLSGWLIYRAAVRSGDRHVPLAGLQALLLLCLLAGDWVLHSYNVMDDDFLISIFV